MVAMNCEKCEYQLSQESKREEWTIAVMMIEELSRQVKQEAYGHSIEYITHTSHSIAFLHFMTL